MFNNQCCYTRFGPGSRGLHCQPGFSLVEVLVAALILGVGLMGILGLQVRSIQFNQQAYYYSQANILLQDISERMRTNKGASARYRTEIGQELSGSENCASSSCSSQQIAAWDLEDWKNHVKRALPNGDAKISAVSGGVVVTVEFDGGNRFLNGGVQESLSLVVYP